MLLITYQPLIDFFFFRIIESVWVKESLKIQIILKLLKDLSKIKHKMHFNLHN